MNKETIHNKSEKVVYFIRHGESVGNAAGVFQTYDGGLSPEGEQQVRALAERFRNISVDVILASTMARARQTAMAIHSVIQKPIKFSDLLIEVRRPSELQGKSHHDKEMLEVRKMLRIEEHESTWRYADEENFTDRIVRARSVIDMLLSWPEKNIAVVSHGTFIPTVLAYMALGKKITPSEYVRFFIFFHKFNTGISMCNYIKDDFGEFRWILVHWNDVAHLG